MASYGRFKVAEPPKGSGPTPLNAQGHRRAPETSAQRFDELPKLDCFLRAGAVPVISVSLALRFVPKADIALPIRFLPIRRKARCRSPRVD